MRSTGVMRNVLVLAVVGVTAWSLAGCSSGEKQEAMPSAPHATRLAMPLGEVKVPPLELQTHDDGTMTAEFTSEALFDKDSDQLRPEIQPMLDQLKSRLGTGASMAVRIDGYTDGIGNEAHNLDLSQRRAQSLATQIQDFGLASQVQACGRGEVGTDGESEDPAARRVVITLSETPFPEDCK